MTQERFDPKLVALVRKCAIEAHLTIKRRNAIKNRNHINYYKGAKDYIYFPLCPYNSLDLSKTKEVPIEKSNYRGEKYMAKGVYALEAPYRDSDRISTYAVMIPKTIFPHLIFKWQTRPKKREYDGFLTLSKFKDIKEGDIVIFKGNKPRKALKDVRHKCITFMKVRGSGTTVYTYSDIYKDVINIIKPKSNERILE
jgi:hypothetical protein